MRVRFFAVSVALCAVLVAAPGVSWAQMVFAPADDTNAPSSEPINPNGSSSGQDSGGVFLPSQNGSNQYPSGIQAPDIQQPTADLSEYSGRPTANSGRATTSRQVVPPSERDSFAYDTLGLEVKSGVVRASEDPLAAYTPEQIEIARKGFEAMEASNPRMAAHNPLRRIEAMKATEQAQNSLMARAKTACDVQSFNVLVSTDTFMNDPEAVAGLTKGGVQAIGNVLQDLCSDREMRSKVASSVPLVTIVNRAGARTAVNMNTGIITIVSDFANGDPLQPAQIRQAFVDAVLRADKFMQGGTQTN